MKDLHEIAGKILAIKTIYGEMYEDYLRPGSSEAGEWIHNLLLQSLDEVYNDLTLHINAAANNKNVSR